ncbi:PilZ domain-containing protein [Erythrobacter sp. THAF29]|uniref:PilZ domain-containing protein n=1 Tax=Erythrobacter sp. THAF29 TaxID=2587851 RepID=UPI0012A9D66F|nr:PilZ domain-containing protein [Erythrobacter sp. THAF29]QFT76058.1 PilZ domain protein [Erythrobacter sp. THAF29]
MAKRASKKAESRISATVRYHSRAKMEMPVLDINVGGCMLDARGWSVKPNERVSVKLPGLAFVSAIVVWIEDQRAGLAFDEALYAPTLEHLQG